MTSVAALIVTSNSQRWIEQTLVSVLAQRRPADEIVVLDDGSVDQTTAIVAKVLGDRAHLVRATSRATDRTTRIAHNFHQGIRACRAHDVVVLGDHDDVWHPDRIGRQVEFLLGDRDAVMVASDGRLVDEHGRATGGTLRETFPVPNDWAELTVGERVRYAVRHSIATGGASAVRPAAFADLDIPERWLHDRWWSLVATVRGGMCLDAEAAIDYRVSATQEVGLDRGRQAAGWGGRLGAAASSAPEVLGKLRDLSGRLRPLATSDEARAALSWPSLITALR